MISCNLCYSSDIYIMCVKFDRVPVKGELIELPGELYVVENVKYMFNRTGECVSTIVYVKRRKKKRGNAMFL